MSGVYKSIQPKDVRTTPYRAHKTVTTTFTNDVSNTGECKVYEAKRTSNSSYDFLEKGRTNIDNGNPYFTGQFETTTDGYYKTAIHSQLDHLFYREYLTNNKATLGGGAPITFQYRDLGYIAKVISFGTKKIGEGILPDSLQITASLDGTTYTVKDDIYGNLVFNDGTDPVDYDNVMSSFTFNKYYEYVSEGLIGSIEEPVCYGSYKLHASYSNVSFNLSGSSGPTVALDITPANSSSLVLSGDIGTLESYNMLNRDYAIAFGIKLNSTPTVTKVLLAKQDKVTDFAVNIDGDILTNTDAPSQYPYKISINSVGRLFLQKSDSQTTLTANSTNALTTGQWANVVLMRNGSNFYWYLNGSQNGSPASDSFLQGRQSGSSWSGSNAQTSEQNCANRCNIYVGNSYLQNQAADIELSYLHFFDRSLTTAEITNLHNKAGWLGNYCGNVYYNLGMVVLTHPFLASSSLTALTCRGTVSMRETEVYCTVGPNEFNVSHNRSLQYWNPITDQFEIDPRYTGSLFRPYITSIGLYNDKNELLAVAKLSTPIQTSRTTDTTFVVKYDF